MNVGYLTLHDRGRPVDEMFVRYAGILLMITVIYFSLILLCDNNGNCIAQIAGFSEAK